MKMNFTVSFLLFAFISLQLFGNVSAGGSQQQYVPVGCFVDSFRHRALPELVTNFRSPPRKVNWNNLNQTIAACAQDVARKGYVYFSIQYYGECWSGSQAHITYDRLGISKACVAGVGKSLANYVYRFVGKEKECSEYQQLSSNDRSMNYKSSQTLCDNKLQHGWYRFTNQAGTRLAESCVVEGCGAIVRGWFNGKVPSVLYGVARGRVCFSWGQDCCKWSQEIEVRDCGRFNVYKLGPTFACPLRFCASN